MGAGQMLQRLTAQVGSETEAKRLLIARGHMTENGAWTPAGAARNAMTAAERAKDRESKRTGLPTSYFRYDPKTNRATKR
jgi:2-hydroxychromene-2-carboxylate isomerase